MNRRIKRCYRLRLQIMQCMTKLRKQQQHDENSFRLISGDFYLGETVTVEHVMSGKQYTRKVRNDSWDLYVTINNSKCYWDCNRVD